MTSPIAAEIDFTAPCDCKVQLTAGFEMAITGGSATDWGGSNGYQVVIAESPVGGGTNVTASTRKPVTNTRARYMDIVTASVAAGSTIACAVQLTAAPGITVTAWNIDLRAEIIKR